MFDHNPNRAAEEPRCQCCPGSAERRNAPRYPFNSAVVLVDESGRRINGIGVNISGSGMLVQLDSCDVKTNGENRENDNTISFQAGEIVTVDVEFDGCCDQPILRWGIGRVVRVEGQKSAIHLCAGAFYDRKACMCAHTQDAGVRQNKTSRQDAQITQMLIEKIPDLCSQSKGKA